MQDRSSAQCAQDSVIFFAQLSITDESRKDSCNHPALWQHYKTNLIGRLFDHFNRIGHIFADPRDKHNLVTLIDSNGLQGSQRICVLVQQSNAALAFTDIGGMNQRPKPKPIRVNNHLPRTTRAIFPRVLPLVAAGFRGLDALTTNHCAMRLCISLHRFTDTFTEEVIDAYPGSIVSLLLTVIEHGTFGREAFRQQAPLTAGAILGAQCIVNLPHIDGARAAGWRRFAQRWSDFRPFFVGHISWVFHRVVPTR